MPWNPDAARTACARHVERALRIAFAWIEDQEDQNDR
jgi:hypothetical protein